MFALPQTRHHLKVNERLGLQAVLGEGIPSQAGQILTVSRRICPWAPSSLSEAFHWAYSASLSWCRASMRAS